MAKLPPLRIPKSQAVDQWKPGELPEGMSGREELGKLYKDTAQLLTVSIT